MRRVVLDSNVFVSAFAMPQGIMGRIIDEWEDEQFVSVVSEYIVTEVRRVLEEKFKLPANVVRPRISALYALGEMVEPALVRHAIIDEEDFPIMGTALAGAVDVIVTGDKKLLNVEQFHGIPIITPRQFLESLEI
ncbi:MAG: putative toxin-antitoxin system toxin component, PIN family [bacterium]|nr:putative toxin-antitoxin system toxin component, PIN family [bacterium]